VAKLLGPGAQYEEKYGGDDEDDEEGCLRWWHGGIVLFVVVIVAVIAAVTIGGATDGPESESEFALGDTNFAGATMTMYINPADTQVGAITWPSSTLSSTFSAVRDRMGIPSRMVRLTTTGQDQQQINATVDPITVHTSFDNYLPVNTNQTDNTSVTVTTRELVISRVVSGKSGFKPEYLRDDSGIAVAVKFAVTGADGGASLVTNATAFSAWEAAVQPREHLSEADVLEFLTKCDNRSYLVVSVANEPDAAVDFVIEGNGNVSDVVRAGVPVGGGVTMLTLPTCKAPTSDAWQALHTETTTNEIQRACGVVKALRSAVENTLCDEVYDLFNRFKPSSANKTRDDCKAMLNSWSHACEQPPSETAIGQSRRRRGLYSGFKRLPVVKQVYDLFDFTKEVIIDKIVPHIIIPVAYAVATTIVGSAIVIVSSASCLYQFLSDPVEVFVPQLHVRCAGLQEAGGDTPDTSIANLGQSSGDFVYWYETFTIRDQIIIRHGGEVIFDTGCVGEQASRSITLADGVPSTEIEVEVIPNCEGTTSTAWEYKVSCPDNGYVLDCSNFFETQCLCVNPANDERGRLPVQSKSSSFNGCGPAKELPMEFPMVILPERLHDQFNNVCNQHDICYGTCGANRAACDRAFCQDLVATCGLGDPSCPIFACMFCDGVTFGGRIFFPTAQEELCSCEGI
jgi:hypothetical protein